MSQKTAFANNLPSEIDVRSADQLRQIIASSMTDPEASPRFEVVLPDQLPIQVVLTHGVANTLMDMLRLIASGRGLRLIPYDAFLTTQEAADLLNVSRPHLIKLIDTGNLACDLVGRQRRIRAIDLFRFLDDRDIQRDEALAEMINLDDEGGLL